MEPQTKATRKKESSGSSTTLRIPTKGELSACFGTMELNTTRKTRRKDLDFTTERTANGLMKTSARP